MNNKNNKITPLALSLTTFLILASPFPSNATEVIPEVLTVQEVSGLLRVQNMEVLRLAEAQEIPARKFGKEWRFNRTAVMAWLAGKDPVGATIMADNAPKQQDQTSPTVSATSNNSLETMARRDLSDTVAMGTNGVQQADTKGTQKPETIGEKRQTKTADEVFLRDQAILLKPRQVTLELGLLYARNDRSELVPFQHDFNDTSVVQGQSEADSFSSNFSVRYGLWDNLQIFSSVPISHQSQSLSVGSQEISNQTSTRWGSVTAGLRYAALAEGSGYPGVILSVDGSFPTDNSAYGVGGSIALTKSFDPAVLFFNAGYRHFFNGQKYNPIRLSADDQFNVTAGIAYALNDTLTLSTSLSGLFHARTRLQDNLILASREQYSLQFGLTSYLAKGLYVEPFVNFGLNGTSSDVTIGLNLPYTFDM